MSTTDDLDTKSIAPGVSSAGAVTPPPDRPTPRPVQPDRPPAKPRETSYLGRVTLGAALVAVGILAILDNISALDIDAGPRHYLALATAVVGVGLLVGSVRGRARWLIFVGIILIPNMVFYSAASYDWGSPRFNREVTPASFAEVDEDMSVEVGRLVIDLTELPWDGEEVSLDAEVAVGSMVITVPDGVGIVGRAGVDIGIVQEPGRQSSGLGERELVWNEPGENGTLLLDADVNIGNLEIAR